MAPDVAALQTLRGHSRFAEPDDLVFAGVAGGPLDGSALRRYRAR
jgi:hypothetical protein